MRHRKPHDRQPGTLPGLALALLALVMLSLWPISDLAGSTQQKQDMVASMVVGGGSAPADVIAPAPDNCQADASCLQALDGVSRTGVAVPHDPDSHVLPDLSIADVWSADAREPVPIG